MPPPPPVQSVEVIGAEDKRGCTVLITTCGDGSVLPMQMIFGGKTEASLPKTDSLPKARADGHDFTVSESHWCTVQTLKRWVQKVLYPAYVDRCRAAGLEVGVQECVLQFDVYRVSLDTFSIVQFILLPCSCIDCVTNMPFAGAHLRRVHGLAARGTSLHQAQHHSGWVHIKGPNS